MGQATDKQAGFIRTLLAEREVGAEAERIITALNSGALDSKSASNTITKLLAAPRKPKTAAVSPWAVANAALTDVDTSFYAIPAGYVSAQRIDLYGSDYLFARVRNGRRGKELMRVHGSPGSPRYSRMAPEVVVVLSAIMQERRVEFAKLWHEHSGRCGRCNATLTDQTSRDTGFGPDCRKIIGL